MCGGRGSPADTGVFAAGAAGAGAAVGAGAGAIGCGGTASSAITTALRSVTGECDGAGEAAVSVLIASLLVSIIGRGVFYPVSRCVNVWIAPLVNTLCLEQTSYSLCCTCLYYMRVNKQVIYGPSRKHAARPSGMTVQANKPEEIYRLLETRDSHIHLVWQYIQELWYPSVFSLVYTSNSCNVYSPRTR